MLDVNYTHLKSTDNNLLSLICQVYGFFINAFPNLLLWFDKSQLILCLAVQSLPRTTAFCQIDVGTKPSKVLEHLVINLLQSSPRTFSLWCSSPDFSQSCSFLPSRYMSQITQKLHFGCYAIMSDLYTALSVFCFPDSQCHIFMYWSKYFSMYFVFKDNEPFFIPG